MSIITAILRAMISLNIKRCGIYVLALGLCSTGNVANIKSEKTALQFYFRGV